MATVPPNAPNAPEDPNVPAVTLLAQDAVDLINKWRFYREPNPKPFTPEEATAYFRTRKYSETQIPLPDIEPPFIFPNTITALELKQWTDPIELTGVREQFLKRTIPGLKTLAWGGKNVWQGVKFLGEGGHGMVGLWNYARGPKYVVVKELHSTIAYPEFNSLREEGRIMQKLRDGPHIVKILADPTVISPEDEAFARLEPRWTNVVRRLLIEYCSMGCMQDLIKRRQIAQKPLSEYTLWKIFNCLIDGITYMGAQAELNDNCDPIPTAPSEIVHFDIKPANMLMNPKNSTHSNTPVFKFGDFGLAAEFASDINWTTPENLRLMAEFRDRCTPSCFAPEQFTAAWDYSDFDENPMVGRYNWQTNVFGIGILMHSLATLSGPIDIREPFLPSKPEGPDYRPFIAKGPTYGKNLDAYPYSDNLKITIWSCLYENKENRMSALDLKQRVLGVMKICEERGANVDDYADLIPPEPKPAVPEGPVLESCWCAAVVTTGPRKGKKCGRRAYPLTKKDIKAGLARCLHHPLGAFPDVAQKKKRDIAKSAGRPY